MNNPFELTDELKKELFEKHIGKTNGSITEFSIALRDLKHAFDFYDKIKGSTLSEQIAVGRDDIDWVLSAARKVSSFVKREPEL